MAQPLRKNRTDSPRITRPKTGLYFFGPFHAISTRCLSPTQIGAEESRARARIESNGQQVWAQYGSEYNVRDGALIIYRINDEIF